MAVYVRLATGDEDAYQAYNGCWYCAYPLTPAWGRSSEAHCGEDGCPNCHEYSEHFNGNEGYPFTVVRLTRWNPDVKVRKNGALVVKRWNTRLGLYPQEAWVSYRSD